MLRKSKRPARGRHHCRRKTAGSIAFHALGPAVPRRYYRISTGLPVRALA